MKVRVTAILVHGLVWSALALPAARASSALFAASPYNVFVSGNFTLSGSDTQGSVAAGGVVSSTGGVSFGSSQNSPPAPYVIVAGDDLDITGSGTAYGNVYEGTSGTISNQFTVTGTLTVGGTDPIDFSNTFQQLETLSSNLSQLPTTAGDGCVDNYGTITCTANAMWNVINIPATGSGVTAATLASNSGIVVDYANPNATVIINVAGTSEQLGSGTSITTNNSEQNIIWNYYQATTLALDGSEPFSLLAPYAAVSVTSGQVAGNFIAASMTQGTAEFHDQLFTGTLTPEPNLALPIGAGLVLFSCLLRVRANRMKRPVSPLPRDSRAASERVYQ